MKNLHPDELPDYYIPYINEVKSLDIIIALEENLNEFVDFLQDELPEDKYLYRYAEGKWCVLEIIQHLIDSERIFVYRALTIARFDKTILPCFDENNYVLFSNASHRSLEDLLHEFITVRNSTISLYQSLTEEMLMNKGCIMENEISVRALGYIIVGHSIHHLNVIKSLYLN